MLTTDAIGRYLHTVARFAAVSRSRHVDAVHAFRHSVGVLGHR